MDLGFSQESRIIKGDASRHIKMTDAEQQAKVLGASYGWEMNF
jgi:hypothetical protein